MDTYLIERTDLKCTAVIISEISKFDTRKFVYFDEYKSNERDKK